MTKFKKVLLLIAMLFSLCLNSQAQTQYYKAQNFAIASVYNGHYNWGEWSRCDITIVMDLDNDVITVYSKAIQKYVIIGSDDAYTDSDGGRQIKFYVIDQDGDRGNVRLRVQRDSSSQIYVDFNDVAWCYGNVIRLR